jgi:colicin import membrane protein
MPGFFQEHLRPLAGSAGLHVALLALLAGAALKWQSEQPPVELAIEGFVTELPPARPVTQARPAPAAPAPKPVEAPPVPVDPVVEPPQERRAEETAAAERAAQIERERRQTEEQATRQREAQLAQEREAQQAREQAAAQQRRAEEAERKRAAEAEAERKRTEAAAAQRKAAEEETRRKAEAAEAKRQAEREAAVRAERESELQRLLAAEEEAAAFARSGVVDEYRLLLSQAIERNWIRPPSARAGLVCTLYVTQAPGGTVVDVRLGTCNGDQAVRESITNAVFRASPLPPPRDSRAFERRLEIVFKPTE